MKKIFLFTLLFFQVSLLLAQTIPNKKIFNKSNKESLLPDLNKNELRKIERTNSKQFKRSYRSALRAAKRNNWPVKKIFSDGRKIELQGLDKLGKPIYYTTHDTPNASEAALTTKTNELWAGGKLGLGLSGSSSAITGRLGIWDGGPVRSTHQEFNGRVSQQDKTDTVLDDHATHVSGIMISSGVNPQAKGMAYKTTLKAWDWNDDAAEISSAASKGLLISNHSYGLGNIGWIYNPDRQTTNKWEWWGNTNISATEDYRFGYYDDFAQQLDKIAFNAPNYLLVIAAGNSRGENGPGAGSPYYLGSSIQTSTITRRSQSDYDLVSSGSLAKNVLTIGAVYPSINGNVNASKTINSSFGNWGPTDDGRIKPDVMGDGLNVLSSIATSDNAYARYSGTSMASPNVAGSILLLQEYYFNLKKSFLRASTLKGIAIHTADDAGPAGPDYAFGWGVLNTERAAEVVGNKDSTHLILEKNLVQGKTDTLQIISAGSISLKASLSWTDPEAVPLPINSSVLNNTTPRLVNDLDLRILDDNNTFLPWILNVANPSDTASQGDNKVDNTEQILLLKSVPGRAYKLVVQHKGNLKNASQNYSLIVSGVGGKFYCTSSPISNTDSKIASVKFGSIDNTWSSGCATYSDFTDQSTDIGYNQDSPIPISVGLGTCGLNKNKIVKIFIDWNRDFDFDDLDELVATSSTISGSSNYNTSITVPSGLIANTATRMRVVCTETSNPTDVGPCGSYDKGETEDYTLRFVLPSFDVLPIALISPDSTTCSSATSRLIVTIKNNGSKSVINIPITAVIIAEGNSTTTLQGILKDSLSAGEEKEVVLEESFNLTPATTYNYQISTSLLNDEVNTNNILQVTQKSRSLTAPPNASVFLCGPANITLASGGEGSTLWYISKNSTDPIAVGNRIIVQQLTTDSTYYVGQNDLNVSIGPKSKSNFTGGGYGGGYTPTPLITTYTPLMIDSARIYVGNSGKLIFSVTTSKDSIISSTEIEVRATKNPPARGDSNDDANDKGEMYGLNLPIPTPGNYKIKMDYLDDASLYRSNAGVTSYPFIVPNVASLSGALFDGDTLKNAYYYLYDIRLKSLGCPSERSVVKATKGIQINPVISPLGPTTVCNDSVELTVKDLTGLKYQWRKDGNNIPLANAYTYKASESGSYSVIVENGECTSSPSNAIAVNIIKLNKPIISINGNTLTSSYSEGNQWILNGREIQQSTDKTFTTSQSGIYSVKVSTTQCSITSDTVSLYIEPPVTKGIWLFPNPATNNLSIKYRAMSSQDIVEAFVFNPLGQQINSINLEPEFRDIYSAGLNVSSLPTGVYFVKVKTGNETWVKRFIKD